MHACPASCGSTIARSSEGTEASLITQLHSRCFFALGAPAPSSAPPTSSPGPPPAAALRFSASLLPARAARAAMLRPPLGFAAPAAVGPLDAGAFSAVGCACCSGELALGAVAVAGVLQAAASDSGAGTGDGWMRRGPACAATGVLCAAAAAGPPSCCCGGAVFAPLGVALAAPGWPTATTGTGLMRLRAGCCCSCCSAGAAAFAAEAGAALMGAWPRGMGWMRRGPAAGCAGVGIAAPAPAPARAAAGPGDGSEAWGGAPCAAPAAWLTSGLLATS